MHQKGDSDPSNRNRKRGPSTGRALDVAIGGRERLPGYRTQAGRELRAPSELMLHAVTLDPGYAKRVDQCSIQPLPGFDGREVIWRRSLPAGASFRVTGVRRCTNCLLEERVELILRPRAQTPAVEPP